MPYSMDAEDNKKNPDTPSPFFTLHEQLIYKLAALDASMQSGFRRLDEKMDRFQSDLHDSQIESNDRINRLESETNARFLIKRQRMDALEKEMRTYCKEDKLEAVETRVGLVETWQKIITARFTLAIGTIVVLWTIFGRAVQDFLAKVF